LAKNERKGPSGVFLLHGSRPKTCQPNATARRDELPHSTWIHRGPKDKDRQIKKLSEGLYRLIKLAPQVRLVPYNPSVDSLVRTATYDNIES